MREHELDAHFLDFANTQMIEAPGVTPQDIAGNNDEIARLDAAFGAEKTPAGYTYFGQFVDHDITFDPASSLVRQNDPEKLKNFRTPRLDLDNVYGRGPDDQPYLYDHADKGKFNIGQIENSPLLDLPRTNRRDAQGNPIGRAIIGDPRNDENSIVCQVQLAFLLAHNTLVDRAKKLGIREDSRFDEARRALTWLYQWIVWNDFLKRIVDPNIHSAALKLATTPDGRHKWELGLEDIFSWRNQPFMPVEFSGAAYRFGHSMVRNSYQTNQPHQGFGNFIPIFNNTGDPATVDLRGFRPLTEQNYIQWDWFLPMTSSSGPFPQLARRIDTKLCNALAFLHERPMPSPMNILPYLNLKRGWSLGLPSGPEVAKKLGLPITPLGTWTNSNDVEVPEPESLWFYILKEAEAIDGDRMGPLGSIILCSTFAGLLKGDPNSFMNLDPNWNPDDESLLNAAVDRKDSGDDWELSSIIRLSGLPIDFSNEDIVHRAALGATIS